MYFGPIIIMTYVIINNKKIDVCGLQIFHLIVNLGPILYTIILDF